MKPEAKYFSTQLGNKEVSFETGRIARLAGGSVILRQGDSMMFAAATMGGVREGTDFFPLTVDYEERMYAGGKIPGSFFRREGRPSTDATLVARLTDRPLRPLFNKDMRNEVQVIVDVYGLQPGVHKIAPTVIVPEGIKVESLLPDIVEVEISPKVQPTPSPAVTDTPAVTPTSSSRLYQQSPTVESAGAVTPTADSGSVLP